MKFLARVEEKHFVAEEINNLLVVNTEKTNIWKIQYDARCYNRQPRSCLLPFFRPYFRKRDSFYHFRSLLLYFETK